MNIYGWAEDIIYGASTTGPRKLCLDNSFGDIHQKSPENDVLLML